MGPETLMPWFAWGAPRLLFVLGLGFLGANLKVAVDLIRYRQRRQHALLTWRGPRPVYYRLNMLLAVTLGLLLAAKLVRKEPDRAFGEAMMFVYYACLFPLSTRIARGFYGDGGLATQAHRNSRRATALQSYCFERAGSQGSADPALPTADQQQCSPPTCQQR